MFTVREPARRGRLDAATTPRDLPVATVAAYVWHRRRAYGAHIVGMSTFVMIVYALNLWGPTYLIRTFGYSVAGAGWAFGLVMIGAGTAGLLIAGTVADRWTARGQSDAYVRIILASMVAIVPFVVALGVVSNPAIAIPVLATAIFFSAFQGGLAGGVIQTMTPNEMRAQVMALYLFVANLVGLGLGPTVVAATTDYVFADDAAIGRSIALAGAVLCPLAALVLWSGLGAIRAEIEAARRFSD
jgi:MFS family permease